MESHHQHPLLPRWHVHPCHRLLCWRSKEIRNIKIEIVCYLGAYMFMYLEAEREEQARLDKEAATLVKSNISFLK